ncbi:MAG: formate dehydrogenase accessory sulfurtransferase FdhD [Deltaproteobacteria bacterium]|nr:formate dehydrogenase accessory sulfurtransferase FdhD [Deltaproteobacteria bacterium]
MASGLIAVELATGPDVVPVEAALELVVDDRPLAVLMRTPTGDDLALAAGFLWSEGVIEAPDDLAALAPCRDPADPQAEHRVLARLAAGVPEPRARTFDVGSACGLCGTTRVDDIVKRLSDRGPPRPLDPAEVSPLSDLARPHQALFRATGAVHGAALFDGVTLVDLREDVGRHNAVDKLLGAAFLAGRPLVDLTLWVSGRVAFEIVQKAAIAGVRAVVGVGGTTSLAVALARRIGLPLVAFARGERMNVYAP